jgi:hypothetical protein
MDSAAHSPGFRPWSGQGAWQLQQEGKKFQAAGLRSGTELWTQQKQPSARPSCHSLILEPEQEADTHCQADQLLSTAEKQPRPSLLFASCSPFFPHSVCFSASTTSSLLFYSFLSLPLFVSPCLSASVSSPLSLSFFLIFSSPLTVSQLLSTSLPLSQSGGR